MLRRASPLAKPKKKRKGGQRDVQNTSPRETGKKKKGMVDMRKLGGAIPQKMLMIREKSEGGGKRDRSSASSGHRTKEEQWPQGDLLWESCKTR